MKTLSTFAFMLFFLGLVVPTAALAVVEYFLARVESPWPGRILPILSGVYSLLMALMVLLNMSTAISSLGMVVLTALAVLVLLNIPTAIFLAVYRTTRRHFAEKRNMDHRDIQDL